jgi:hypothetical protein
MAQPEVTAEDMVYLFFPETDAGRAAGHEHLAKIATRLAAGPPSATLVVYSDAGHAFLFQRVRDFTTQVTSFLDG